MELTMWLEERELNARLIAAGKTGDDRDGWLEDSDYLHAAVAAVQERDRLRMALLNCARQAEALKRRQLADYADLSALRAEDGGNVLMSDAMNLPTLPLRYDLVTRANPETGGYRDVPVYSADDMRAYGEACAAAEREAWMKAIHSAGVDWLAERAIRAKGKT